MPRWIVITDLDGTLLDGETYSCEASLPAVRKLLSLHIPLVLCSSKTSSEIIALWEDLGLKDPFISENGGAIYFPPNYFPFALEGVKSKGSWEALEFGTDVTSLRGALSEAARQCRVKVKSFGTMSSDEVSRLTGLGRKQAVLALRREYNEPFLVEEGETEELFTALRARGLTVVRGGRLFHVTGGHDKGATVKVLLGLYRRLDPNVVSIGLGNSGNDLPLLSEVDRPISVRNADGTCDPEIVKNLPQVERTRGIGPHGWREAVERVLTDLPS